MKKMTKSILKYMGIYTWLYKFYIDIQREKYADFPFCSMDFEGVKLKFNTNDKYSNSWFFPRFGKGYIHEPGATKIFVNNVREGTNVFDIGGHLGYFSCVAGKLSNSGTVCVFEMDFNCIDLIKKNIELNKLKNINIYNVAVSDSSGSVTIPDLKVPDPGIRIESFKNLRQLEVSSLTIDEFISQENIIPDFIKIDVEGAEFKVLKGMSDILKNKSLVLLIEIHVSQLLKYFDTDYKDVLKFLSEFGFKFEKVEHHRSKKMALHKIDYTDELKGNVMVLCKKQ